MELDNNKVAPANAVLILFGSLLYSTLQMQHQFHQGFLKTNSIENYITRVG